MVARSTGNMAANHTFSESEFYRHYKKRRIRKSAVLAVLVATITNIISSQVRAETITLVCDGGTISLDGNAGSLAGHAPWTFIVNTATGTVFGNNGPYDPSGTWRATITDQTINWKESGVVSTTIDRYSMALVRINPAINYYATRNCRKAERGF